ncbi:MAG TPA: malto-oligosyltrehalose synthase [Egicoccus sp.]|nr:malto-oligosyltrehalose synthase [Egicoccus sp.]HSK24520.1 malto-oligosyltrehalose synthase [Egicoccus sp.]
MTTPVRPTGTYRLQLHAGYTFDDAVDEVPYLAELGVSHLYLSPSLQAAPGSTHGYDVVDPGRLSDDLGGEAGFDRLVAACRANDLRLVLDLVPNHVGLISPHNPWWWDVLRHGPDSRYAAHFDIRWRTGGDGLPQVLVPHLGRPLEEELSEGEDLRLSHAGDAGATAGPGEVDDPDAVYRIVYHEHAWPLRPGSLRAVGADARAVRETLAAFETDPGRLFSLLQEQHYRLVHWQRANRELNYRRFFDITTLGGVRVEDPAVFGDVHRRALDLVGDGIVEGLRIDHPDGLYDPAEYFRRLREAAPGAWIVVEKILEAGEPLRDDWPVDGTTGYEFANDVLGLYVDGAATAVLDDLYRELAGRDGDTADYGAIVDAAKHRVLDQLLVSEFRALHETFVDLARQAGVVCEDDDLSAALRAVLVAFGVYRTYVRADVDVVGDLDRRYVREAVARARARHPHLHEALDLLQETLLVEHVGVGSTDFVMRFQQLTGPVMAKGVEDTVFYRYLRFAAVNEVGGDPSHLGTDPAGFHEANRRRQRRWPSSMLTTSTHDTKRSEDVRARLAPLTEIPDVWVRTVEEWLEITERHVGRHGQTSPQGRPSPAVVHRYLTLQTLLGTWPITADRAVDYLVKAAREGKQYTDWIDGDERYEDDLAAYVRAVLADTEAVTALETLLDRLRPAGWLTSLSQTLLKLTSPGVPDIYQGCELWDLSLVDPDNRRPVDFDARSELLKELQADAHPVELLGRMQVGASKLWVTHRALHLRRRLPEVFGADGDYVPLHADGIRADHVVAFVRGGRVATIAPRLVLGLGGRFEDWDWRGSSIELPPGTWRCELTGQVVPGGRSVGLAEVLTAFPVALLVREGEPS